MALAACHHNPPHKPGEEYLKTVAFEGNKQIKDKALLNGLALHRTMQSGRPPDPYLVQLDAERLRGQYSRSGFFEADVQGRVERKADASTVIYAIQEGKRATTHVSIEGLPNDPALTPEMVRAKLPLAEGAPFDYDVYDNARTNLLGVVQDAGYAHAKLDGEVWGDIAGNVAYVTLRFNPGPKCRFGSIIIQGVHGDLEEAISDRLQFKTGDTFSNAAITATQRAIYGMNRFSTVQIQPDPGLSDVVNMKVAVSESAAHQVTLGGGFGIDPVSYEVRGRAGYQIAGFPFAFDTLTLDFRPAYAYLRDGTGYEPRIRALARLERQDLFLTYAVGTTEIGYDYLAYEAFTLFGPRGLLGYEARLGSSKLKARVGYLIHHYGFSHASPLLDEGLRQEIGIDHAENVGAFQQSIVADYRDHPLEPREGFYAELRLTEGGPFALGAYTYQQVSPELRGYLPLGPIVLAARGRYGAIYGDAPPTERYYAGGATSQRGFSERRLSPSVTGDVKGRTVTVPYGGTGLIDSSVEGRFPITTIKSMLLGGVVFLDGGDVTSTPGQLSLAKLQYALGAGLRLHTIVGPVRVDFGYRLNRTGAMDPEPGSKFAFHLSLGEAF